MDKKRRDFITLKEASEISGYSQDYLGQLIRKGKLPGKQVYYNVAWVTTEKALHEYMDRSKDGKNTFSDFVKSAKYPLLRFAANGGLERALRVSMYIGVLLSVAVSLLTFYIMSAGIENRLQKKALDALIIQDTQTFNGK